MNTFRGVSSLTSSGKKFPEAKLRSLLSTADLTLLFFLSAFSDWRGRVGFSGVTCGSEEMGQRSFPAERIEGEFHVRAPSPFLFSCPLAIDPSMDQLARRFSKPVMIVPPSSAGRWCTP